MSGQRLCAMLCIRAPAEVREALGKHIKKGTLTDDASFTTVIFPTVSQAIQAAAAMFQHHLELARDCRMAIGVIEAKTGELVGRSPQAIRSLASQAHPGQVLVTSAGRDIARNSLPSRVSFKRIGEVLIETEIAAQAVWQLAGPGIQADLPPPQGLYKYRSNIPQAEGFVGRDKESAELAKLIEPGAAVTVVGPIGTGKSALARYVGGLVETRFRDGAVWIDASAGGDSLDPFEQVATVLGVGYAAGYSASGRLLARLKSSEILLVADGCDDDPEAWRKLANEVVRNCEGVALLSTCRSPLGFTKEIRFGLSSLPIPVAGASIDNLESSEGVILFLRRSGLPRTEAWMSLAANAVRKVEGLPLGIELVAGRIASLVQQGEINEENARVFPIPSNGLEQVVLWSLHSLEPSEIRLLAHLSMLEGHWTQDFALAVCTGQYLSISVAEKAFSGLTRRNLLLEVPGFSVSRFRVAEPISRHVTAISRHLVNLNGFMTKYASQVMRTIKDKQLEGRISKDLIGREYHHISRVLPWLLEHDQTTASELSSLMFQYWLARGPHQQAFEFVRPLALERTLAPEQRARMLHVAGTLAGYAGQLQEAEGLLTEAAELWTCIGDGAGKMSSLGNLAIHLRNAGRLHEGIRVQEAALAGGENPASASRARISVSNATMWAELEEYERCEQAIATAEAAVEASKDSWARGALYYTKALLMIHKNDTVAASDFLVSAMDIAVEVGDVPGLLYAIERLAYLTMRIGQYARATVMLGGTEAQFIRFGIIRPRDLQIERDEAVEELLSAFEAPQAAALVEQGASKKIDELYDFARLV